MKTLKRDNFHKITEYFLPSLNFPAASYETQEIPSTKKTSHSMDYRSLSFSRCRCTLSCSALTGTHVMTSSAKWFVHLQQSIWLKFRINKSQWAVRFSREAWRWDSNWINIKSIIIEKFLSLPSIRLSRKVEVNFSFRCAGSQQPVDWQLFCWKPEIYPEWMWVFFLAFFSLLSASWIKL